MELYDLNQLQHIVREIKILTQRLNALERVAVDDWDREKLEKIRNLLAERRGRLISERYRLEQYIDTVEDSLVRMIMTFRFVDGRSWANTAVRVGGGNTEDSVKKAVYRYLEKHSARPQTNN